MSPIGPGSTSGPFTLNTYNNSNSLKYLFCVNRAKMYLTYSFEYCTFIFSKFFHLKLAYNTLNSCREIYRIATGYWKVILCCYFEPKASMEHLSQAKNVSKCFHVWAIIGRLTFISSRFLLMKSLENLYESKTSIMCSVLKEAFFWKRLFLKNKLPTSVMGVH